MRTINLAILFSGNGSNLENIYTKMQSSIIDLSPNEAIKLHFAIAISSKESAFGITRCANLGLQCEVIDFKTHKENFESRIIETLESQRIELVILAGFMKILSPKFNAKFRALNIHPSILPLFKGAHAIKESFESDMKIAGVSVHFVSDELDSGALIAQDIIHKIDGESFESFEARIHDLEYKIYPKAIIKAVRMVCTQYTPPPSPLPQGEGENLECGASPQPPLTFCDAKSKQKKDLCEAPNSRPLRGAKIQNQGSSSVSAGFLLEAEKRGTPPKSEKAAAFWRVGGVGRGVQPFLQKKTSESSGENNAESAINSRKSKQFLPTFFKSRWVWAKPMKSLFSPSLAEGVRGWVKSQNSKDSRESQILGESKNPLDCHDLTLSNLVMTIIARFATNLQFLAIAQILRVSHAQIFTHSDK